MIFDLTQKVQIFSAWNLDNGTLFRPGRNGVPASIQANCNQDSE